MTVIPTFSAEHATLMPGKHRLNRLSYTPIRHLNAQQRCQRSRNIRHIDLLFGMPRPDSPTHKNKRYMGVIGVPRPVRRARLPMRLEPPRIEYQLNSSTSFGV